MLKQLPNIMGRKQDKGILYSLDNSNYYYFDPEHRISKDIYFLESNLNLLDEWIDIFELTEYDLTLYEQSYVKQHNRYIPKETALADREYISIYLRADDTQRNYKREEYDVLTYFGDLGGLFDFILMFSLKLKKDP